MIKSTFIGLKNKIFFDENFIMTLTTIGSFALGEYSKAVGVVLFFLIGEMFEELAVSQSRKAITEISRIKVEKADVFINGSFKRNQSWGYYIEVDDDIVVGKLCFLSSLNIYTYFYLILYRVIKEKIICKSTLIIQLFIL